MLKISIKNTNSVFDKLNRDSLNLIEKNRAQESEKLKSDLIEVTPIDTGFARSSWSIQHFKDKSEIVNDAPYINYLNEGTSTQAPARFIETTALKYGKPLGTIVQEKP
jgi:hypothetical protein